MTKNKTISLLRLNVSQWSFMIFGLAIILYANTLMHDYTQDDAIVIYDNMFTTQGVAGLEGIFTKDSFFGFFKEEGKANLVSGGRYRPLTMATFALEWQLFGRNTFIGHLLNVLFYGLLCVLIFKTVILFDSKRSKLTISFALLVALIYTSHPIHTEVVANIKGRDEIFSMLGSFAALFFGLKWLESNQRKWMIYSGISLFLGLLSKENAISFLVIIPMTFYFFKKLSISKSIAKSLYLIIPALAFLIIRFSVLGFNFGGTPRELMNNPFLKIVNNSYVDFSLGEKLATIVFSIGKYFQLLFFPLQLSHDYYPRQIGIMTWGDPSVLLAAVMIIISFAFIVLGWKKKQIPSYSILYFFITFFLMSNLIFPIGTTMSERFMFMPSFGYAMILSYMLHYLFMKGNNSKIALMVGFGICSLYGIKTIDRNFDWKDDFTLFTIDVYKSPNSAKINNAAGGTLTQAAMQPENKAKREEYLRKARKYLLKAVEIHPNYKNAYLILGNNYNYDSDYKNAEKYYGIALSIDPNYSFAIKNRAVNFRDLGKNYGEKGDLEKALFYLSKAEEQLKEDYEIYRLLGTAYGMSGNHNDAIKYFTKAAELGPDFKQSWKNLGTAYLNNGDDKQAKVFFDKAAKMATNNE